VKKNSHREGNCGDRGKFTQATFFNRFQPFLDYMSMYLPSSAAVNKKFMDRVTITQGMRPIIGRKLVRSTVRRTTSFVGIPIKKKQSVPEL